MELRHFLDASLYTFMVTRSTSAKVDQQGNQRFRRDDQAPMWSTELLVLDKQNEGGATINVTVAGIRPELTVGQMVRPVELEAIPWNTNGRHGVAYRARELVLDSESAGVAA